MLQEVPSALFLGASGHDMVQDSFSLILGLTGQRDHLLS